MLIIFFPITYYNINIYILYSEIIQSLAYDNYD